MMDLIDNTIKAEWTNADALDLQPTCNQLAKDTNVPSKDTISRQTAIDALHRYFDGMLETDTWSPCDVYGLIEILPSAQPEKLTDKEQRIFLSAMGREEEVCKQVDDAWRDCREPYEDSLVRVCKEIRRKVKGALWET